MSHQIPSIAEEQGWRYYWDGWIICPECIKEHLRRRNDLEPWPVPITYDTPIGEASAEYDTGCSQCGVKPPLELTWKTMTRESYDRQQAIGR